MEKDDEFSKISSLERMLSQAKASTSPVSLRVKDSTIEVLNLFAEKYDMKVGTVINQILDSYADAYRKQKYRIHITVRRNLMPIARKIAILSELELAKLVIDAFKDTSNHLPSYDPTELTEELKKIGASKSTEDCFVHIGDNIIASDDQTRVGKGYTTYELDNVTHDISGIYIPAHRWLAVVYIFNEYAKICQTEFSQDIPNADILINCADLISDTETKNFVIHFVFQLARCTDFSEDDDSEISDHDAISYSD